MIEMSREEINDLLESKGITRASEQDHEDL